MKHGRPGLPFTAKRDQGGLYYVARCANRGTCSAVLKMGAPRWLPDKVVCQKIEENGWLGEGFLRRDVPKRFYCPTCQTKKAPKMTDTLSSLPETTPTRIMVQTAAYMTKGKALLYIRVPDELAKQHNLKEGDYLLPTFSGSVKDSPLQVTIHRGLKSPPNGYGYAKLVRTEKDKKALITRTTTSPASKRLTEQGWAFGTISLEYDVISPNFWRTSQPFGRIVTPSAAGTAKKRQNTSPSTSSANSSPKTLYSPSEGKDLCEMLSAWIKSMRKQGWRVEVRIEPSGKIDLAISQHYSADGD